MSAPSEHDEHIAFLKTKIRATEVAFRHGIECLDLLVQDGVLNWLQDNIGKKRPYDIYREACTGWVDYFEGDWSVHYRSGHLVFWFSTQLQAAKFMLMFGGSAGAGMKELD